MLKRELCLSVRELKVLKRRAERGFVTVGGSGFGGNGDPLAGQPADAADYAGFGPF